VSIGVLLQGSGEAQDLSAQPPAPGLEHAALGVGEAGEVEGGELGERALGGVEPLLELAGG